MRENGELKANGPLAIITSWATVSGKRQLMLAPCGIERFCTLKAKLWTVTLVLPANTDVGPGEAVDRRLPCPGGP